MQTYWIRDAEVKTEYGQYQFSTIRKDQWDIFINSLINNLLN